MDFRETFREIWIECVYLIDNARGKEPIHDIKTKRTAHYERAFGRQRPLYGKGYNHFKSKESPISMKIEVD